MVGGQDVSDVSPKDVDPLDGAILRQLLNASERWAQLSFDELTALEQQAISLLTGAGLVERKFSLRLSLIGHPVRIELTAVMTGEGGLAQAMEPALHKAWSVWADFYREHHGGSEEERPTFFAEKTAPQMWRLTGEGVSATGDIAKGERGLVLDFVRRRTPVFAGKVVSGQGRTERIKETHEAAEPSKVEVTNLSELSGPLEGIVALLQKAFERIVSREERPANSPDKTSGTTGESSGSSSEAGDGAEAAAVQHLPKPKVSSDPPKRSWTQPDLDEAIRTYKAKRGALFQRFVSLLDDPKTSASRKRSLRKDAQKKFGRNAIARALGVKSAKMVSHSQPWISMAELLGLPRQAGKTAGPSRPRRRIGEEIAVEQASMAAADEGEDTSVDTGIIRAEREKTLRQIRMLAKSEHADAKPKAEALLGDYEADEMTDDEVRQAVKLLIGPVEPELD